MAFGRNKNDKLYRWLLELNNCEVLWDIGSANGLEGFMVNFLHGSKIVFIEPFTPSIESILKTHFIVETKFKKKLNTEVIQAACDIKKGFEKLINHTKPAAGETYNSIEDGIKHYCDGGRQKLSQSSFQWIKKITLDEVLLDLKIQAPSHLKIDVDGLELRVLQGGKKFFKNSKLVECAIEVNDNNPKPVEDFMYRSGFKKIDENIHHDYKDKFTADFFFKRK
jgi:FkbM family methyltransferase